MTDRPRAIPFRHTLNRLAVAAIFALAAASVVGAFLGSDRAARLFNSVPLTAYWMLSAALLVAGIAAFRTLRRSPGLLAAHVGCILVIVGGLWGSPGGHALLNRVTGARKIHRGRMVLPIGRARRHVHRPDPDAPGEVLAAKLPFPVTLEDFWLEFYSPRRAPWSFFIVARGKEGSVGTRPLALEPGGEGLAFGGLRVELLKYVRLAPPTGAPEVAVLTDTGGLVRLPAEPGASARLPDGTEVRVARTFRNLRVEGAGTEMDLVEGPGGTWNPAAELRITGGEGVREQQARFALPPDRSVMMPPPPEGRTYLLLSGRPGRPRQDRWAACVRMTGPAGRRTRMLLSRSLSQHEELPPTGVYADELAWQQAGAPILVARKTIRDYKSRLAVGPERREGAGGVIEVNRPLHYGGYHFYQASYDDQAGRYSVIDVVSDSGLPLVWAGFALLMGGILLRMWVEPLLRAIRARRGAERAGGTAPPLADKEATRS